MSLAFIIDDTGMICILTTSVTEGRGSADGQGRPMSSA